MRGVAMDPTTRARARLFLRSEAAHGQEALPLRKSQRAASAAEKKQKTAAALSKGEKIAPNAAPTPAPKSSIALQQTPAALRQAQPANSIDIFLADGASSPPSLSREEKIRLLAQLEEE